MATLVAIAYDDMDQAECMMRSIGELVKEHSLTLEDAVIAEHTDNGKLKLHQPSLAWTGAASGALWGGVIGLLFLVPVFRTAVGAAAGAAGRAASDYGVHDDFVEQLAEQLPRGGAAVVVLVQECTRDKVVPEISTHGGRLIQSTLSNDQEEAFQESLGHRGAVA